MYHSKLGEKMNLQVSFSNQGFLITSPFPLTGGCIPGLQKSFVIEVSFIMLKWLVSPISLYRIGSLTAIFILF